MREVEGSKTYEDKCVQTSQLEHMKENNKHVRRIKMKDIEHFLKEYISFL